MNSATRRVRLALVLPVVGAAIFAASAAASGGTHVRLVVYAVATRAQYVDFSDGITRAQYQNPFNLDTKTFPPTRKKGASSPGNAAFFSFKLYKDSALKERVGEASYACVFNFNNRATCNADYELGQGSLFASGPVDFSTLHATLAITGGTMTYAGRSGQVSSIGPGSSPAAKSESRLDFELLR